MVTNREVLAAIMAQFTTQASLKQMNFKQASWIVTTIALKMGFTEDEILLFQEELSQEMAKIIMSSFKSDYDLEQKLKKQNL